MSLLSLFVDVDDFCQAYQSYVQQQRLAMPSKRRGPQCSLSLSEVMTIVIHFHQSSYRHFKGYYTKHVRKHLRREFTNLVSYNRFVELKQAALYPFSICAHALVSKLELLSSTPLLCLFVPIAGLNAIRCLSRLLLEGKPQWVGFMVSSCT